MWPITVTPETNSPKAPVFCRPTDPTDSPAAVARVQHRRPRDAGRRAHRGFSSPSSPRASPTSSATANGAFCRANHARNGTPDNPNKGSHKLVFNQGGRRAPRCSQRRHRPAHRRVPPQRRPAQTVREAGLQPVIIGERHDSLSGGRVRPPARVRGDRAAAARSVGEETRIDAAEPPPPGTPLQFQTTIVPGPGRHVVYFFQAPDPPAQATPAGDRRSLPRLRASRRHADQPHRRRPASRRASRFPPGWRAWSAAARLPGHHPTFRRPASRDRSCSARATARTRRPRRASCARCRSRTSTFASADASKPSAPTPRATGR